MSETGLTSGTIFDIDMMIEYDYRVTYEGCKARTYGPPEDCYPAEDPEYEIEGIRLFRDDPNTKQQDIQYLEVPKWLEQIIIDYLYETGDVIENINKESW